MAPMLPTLPSLPTPPPRCSRAPVSDAAGSPTPRKLLLPLSRCPLCPHHSAAHAAQTADTADAALHAAPAPMLPLLRAAHAAAAPLSPPTTPTPPSMLFLHCHLHRCRVAYAAHVAPPAVALPTCRHCRPGRQLRQCLPCFSGAGVAVAAVLPLLHLAFPPLWLLLLCLWLSQLPPPRRSRRPGRNLRRFCRLHSAPPLLRCLVQLLYGGNPRCSGSKPNLVRGRIVQATTLGWLAVAELGQANRA